MRLYLIRHAHAPAGDNDAARPLSERGRQTTAHVASFFRHNGNLRPGQFWHSPLVRAYETAVALEAGLELDVPLVETDGLLPGDDPLIMARRLAEYPTVHDIALVGHEPHLSGLATLLVRGKANPVGFHVKKSAIICLRLSDKVHGRSKLPRWRVAWHFCPELLSAE
ncbi:SixA phosphatase family protein [Synoicihabitans lomoniglobus]|uniref:Histidine phosphatase family protein n=1 Tax=Synoicihabitans lomoniglobus TaxID=2909285 RepID=A0AAE9ZZV6_9BACT|nr:histidine phosphatase family protein [Opitutaceae bacterium LMO-M01]WED64558.1 histidine phosphatase family protein [Opitutaceae bacterium LMO-M01]